MSNIFLDLCYVLLYEWVCLEGDGVYIIGIIEYVQEFLGDMVFVELLDVGD